MLTDDVDTDIQVYDHEAEQIAGAAQWAFYAQDPKKPAHVDVTWLGDEASDEKAYAQDVLNVLHGSRVADYRGPHACTFSTFNEVR